MSIRTLRHAALLLAVTVAAAGCTKNIAMDQVNKAISDGLVAQLKFAGVTVTCPTEPREMKANDAFDCTAVPKEGGKLTVRVTQKDADGNIDWSVTKTEGMLDLAKVEASVTSGMKEQLDVEAKVSCGGRWRGANPGDTFDCQVTVPDGTNVVAKVTVKDAEGNIEWATSEAQQ